MAGEKGANEDSANNSNHHVWLANRKRCPMRAGLVRVLEWLVLLPLWRRLTQTTWQRVAGSIGISLVWLIVIVAIASSGGGGDDGGESTTASLDGTRTATASATPAVTARPTDEPTPTRAPTLAPAPTSTVAAATLAPIPTQVVTLVVTATPTPTPLPASTPPPLPAATLTPPPEPSGNPVACWMAVVAYHLHLALSGSISCDMPIGSSDYDCFVDTALNTADCAGVIACDIANNTDASCWLSNPSDPLYLCQRSLLGATCDTDSFDQPDSACVVLTDFVACRLFFFGGANQTLFGCDVSGSLFSCE